MFHLWRVNKSWTYESNGVPAHLTEEHNSLDTKGYKDTGLLEFRFLFCYRWKVCDFKYTFCYPLCFCFAWEGFCAGRDRIIWTFSRFCGTIYKISWFQAFAVFCMLYAFFWVITLRLEFICRHFGTFCLFHLHTCLWRWNRQNVPKRRHINSRRRVINQKKAYKI